MERIQKPNHGSAHSKHVAQAKFTSRSRENELENSINESPEMVAQRQRFDHLFGPAIQRVEDEEPLQKKEVGEEEFLPGRFGTAQRVEDEEPLQGKFDTAQLQEDEEPIQGRFESSPVQRKEEGAKPNNTGLPDNLKSGIESLSGLSMANVKVHYNSSQPAQLNAHAYAQGTDIHVAPGQEQHLPHEAWHVVQQAQGRVQPTLQMKEGVPVNDDKSLEREADAMGAKAMQFQRAGNARIMTSPRQPRLLRPFVVQHQGQAIQCKPILKDGHYEDSEWGISFTHIANGVFANRAYLILQHEDNIYIYFELVDRYVPYDLAVELMKEYSDISGPAEAAETTESLRRYHAAYYTLMGAGQQLGEQLQPSKPSPTKSQPKPRREGPNIVTFADLSKHDDSKGAGEKTSTNTHLVGTSNGNGTMTYQEQQTLNKPDSSEHDHAVPSGQQETEPEVLHIVLRCRNESDAETDTTVHNPLIPDMGALINAYLHGMEHENLWGDEAAATLLANHLGVQFVIRQLDENGQEINRVIVGNGGALVYLRHHNRHFVLESAEGDVIANVPGNGDCLFSAGFYGVHGRLPTREEIATLRRLVAHGLTLADVQAIVATLLAEAQAGQTVHGVGPTLGALLHPVTFMARIMNSHSDGSKSKSKGNVVGGTLTLEQAREKRFGSTSIATEEKQQDVISSNVEPVVDDEQEAEIKSNETASVPHMEMHSFTPHVMDEYTLARDEYNANLSKLFAREGQINREKQREQHEQQRKEREQQERLKQEELRKAREVIVNEEPEYEPIPLMTTEQIVAFVQTHPPMPGQGLYAYIGEQGSALPDGFMHTSSQLSDLQSAINAALAAEQEASLNRIATFDPNNPTTWVMAPLQFANGITPEMVQAGVGGANAIDNISMGYQGGNTRGRSTLLTTGQPLHMHLQTGSWGLAFIYIFNPSTGRVIPIIYDIAYGRIHENQYKWEKGGNGYNSGADYPKKPEE